MPFASFTQFSAALCETAGVAAPELKADEQGLIAFHLAMGDVYVNVVHMAVPENEDAFVLVIFGLLPEQRKLEVLELLAETNFTMIGAGAPVLGLDPATAEVVLRQHIRLSEAEAADVLADIFRFTEAARQWRVDPTFEQLKSAGGLAVPDHGFA